MNARRPLVLAAGVVALLLVCGLGSLIAIRSIRVSGFGYSSALNSVRASSQDVRDLEQAFPGVQTFFSYYTGTYGDTSWNAVLATREVEINASMPVKLSATGFNATQSGPMSIQILHVSSRTNTPDGGASTSYSGEWTFTLKQLQAKVAGIAEPDARLAELAKLQR